MPNKANQVLRMLNLRPIAVQPVYKVLTGSYSSGVLLSQLMYWYSRVGRPFYKTNEELRGELYMTERELKTAKSHLKNVPFLKIIKKGVPCKTYYDVNFDLYNTVMRSVISKIEANNENVLTSKDETVPTSLDDIVPTWQDETVPTITESTTENTTIKKNTKKKFDLEGYSEDVKETLNDWLEYKNFKYSDVGWKSQRSQLSKAIGRFGESAVIDQIETAIASGWQGMNLNNIKAPDISAQDKLDEAYCAAHIIPVPEYLITGEGQ